jgi:hypothetical protein
MNDKGVNRDPLQRDGTTTRLPSFLLVEVISSPVGFLSDQALQMSEKIKQEHKQLFLPESVTLPGVNAGVNAVGVRAFLSLSYL